MDRVQLVPAHISAEIDRVQLVPVYNSAELYREHYELTTIYLKMYLLKISTTIKFNIYLTF